MNHCLNEPSSHFFAMACSEVPSNKLEPELHEPEVLEPEVLEPNADRMHPQIKFSILSTSSGCFSQSGFLK